MTPGINCWLSVNTFPTGQSILPPASLHMPRRKRTYGRSRPCISTLAPADVKVLDQPCPGLMDCVEKGAFHAPDTVELARRYVAPLVEARADRLVLGCTHYPFLSDVLHEVAGPGVELIDPAPAVVRQLERRLAANDALSDGHASQHRFFTTGANERRAAVLRLLAGEDARLEALGEDFQARTESFESMK